MPAKTTSVSAGFALAAAGLLFIARSTLTPSVDPNGLTLLTPLWCVVCGDTGGADIAANLLLFIPFAVGLRLAGMSWRRTVLVSAALSLTVELLQLVAIPGRDASLSDLLTNTTSGAIGAAIAPHLPAAFRPSRAQAGWLLAGGAIAWLAALGLSAWLLVPSLQDGVLRSGWAGEARGRDIFFGEVGAVQLEGLPMPKNAVPSDSAALRRRLARGRFSLFAEVNSGRPVYYHSWIYKLRADSRDELTLYQLGRQAGISVPVRAVRYLMHPVTVTLPDGLPDVAGLAVRLEATASGGVIRLRSTYSGVTRAVEYGLSPAYGWRLISPFELGAGTGVRWFTALCLTLSVLPLGYWAARAGPVAGCGLAVTIVAGLTLPSLLAGLPPVHWSEWAAAGLGLLAGWALQRGAAYLERRCASPSASESSSP
jgi:VanZ like protein